MDGIQSRLKRLSDDQEIQTSTSKRLVMDPEVQPYEETVQATPEGRISVATSKRLVFDPELQPIESPLSPYEETVYEPKPTVQEYLPTPEGQKSADYFINNWLKR